MTSGVPPAIRRKPADRGQLLHDLDYFLSEVISRIERLQRIDGQGHITWKQAAPLIRRFRSVVRHRHTELLAIQKLEERKARR